LGIDDFGLLIWGRRSLNGFLKGTVINNDQSTINNQQWAGLWGADLALILGGVGRRVV
jgi:hypothetical protein